MKKLLPSSLLILSVFILPGCQEQNDLPPEQQLDYEEDAKPLIEEKTNSSKTKGSCNAIAFGSNCIDYIGSIWTEEQMRLNCQGANVSFSLDACPYPENGGCRMTGGTISETIAWTYPYGGDPISGEVLEMTKGACDINPLGEWVMPDDLLTE
ncbi:hypothetical protein C4566_02285 [Candidatus Parcubacteria bacterium]|nr:MAG: hypothetical protein C4566_02285 [Candidatus Parcubacteria bacterium]